MMSVAVPQDGSWLNESAGTRNIDRFLAFPKNNAGRDTMIDAPSRIDDIQLKELGIRPV